MRREGHHLRQLAEEGALQRVVLEDDEGALRELPLARDDREAAEAATGHARRFQPVGGGGGYLFVYGDATGTS